MSAATPISKSSDAGSSNIPEFDDDLLSSTLKDLSPSRLGQEASQNLERALDDFAERFCPSIKNSPEEEKRRFESCLAKLSKQSDLTQSDNASVHTEASESLLFRGSGVDSDLVRKLEEFGASSDVMQSVVEAFLTKEVLGEPMQSLLGSFGPWLEKFRQSNPPVQQLERYEQQYEIYSEILKLCEAGDGQRSDISQNPIGRVQQFQSLTEKLQTLGEPPQDVLDVLFAMTDDLPESEGGSPSSGEFGRSGVASSTERSGVRPSTVEDPEMKSLLKSLESLVFGMDKKEQTDSDIGKSGLSQNPKSNCSDEDEETMKEDIDGFVKFLKGLGLSGADTDKFLNPDVLMRAAAGDVTEEELIQLVFGAAELSGSGVPPQTSSRPEAPKSSTNRPTNSEDDEPLDPKETCRQQ